MPIAKINGINFNYKVEGQGEPLVMIQGYFATITSWKYQIPTLKKHFQVVSFDNRGIGLSDKPQGPYSSTMMAQDTIGLMDYLDIKKAHILGISLGGAIAQEIACLFPDRVRKLVLVSTWAIQDNGINGLSPETLGTSKIGVRKGTYKILDLSINKFLTRLLFLPLVRLQCNRITEKEAIGLIAQKEASRNHNALDRLQQIKAPTLVIRGSLDRIVKPSSSETLAKLIPDSKLDMVNKGSHAFNWEM